MKEITLANNNQLKTAWTYSPQVTFRLSRDHIGLLCYNTEGEFYHIHGNELTCYQNNIRLELKQGIK